jgi:hypothetical protein
MPSSRPEAIAPVVSIIRQIQPRSILDVGVGFGKWGHLFREYTDILASENDPLRYNKENWRIRIDGIEGYPDYIHPASQYFYSQIFIGDALRILASVDAYDVVFAGDILEHFDLQDGRLFLQRILEKSRRYAILTTPGHETHQGDICSNPLERHRSLWNRRSLLSAAPGRVFRLEADILLAVYATGGEPIPYPRPSYSRGTTLARSVAWLRGNRKRLALR